MVTLLDGLEGGYFVDLASFSAVAYSNTFSLEKEFGWEGLCIGTMTHIYLRAYTSDTYMYTCTCARTH